MTFNPGDLDALKSQLLPGSDASKLQNSKVENMFKNNDASHGSSEKQKSSQQLSMSFP